MHMLIWGFAGRTYHIDGNLMLGLIYELIHDSMVLIAYIM